MYLRYDLHVITANRSSVGLQKSWEVNLVGTVKPDRTDILVRVHQDVREKWEEKYDDQ